VAFLQTWGVLQLQENLNIRIRRLLASISGYRTSIQPWRKNYASLRSELGYCNPDNVLGVPDPVLHTYLHINKMFSLKKNLNKAKKKKIF
jgi:hypothetical protein